MRVCVLASGSEGNCCLIESKETKILIDLGITLSRLEEILNDLKVNPYDISAVFVTHIHDDHIKGLKSFNKKYHPLIFASEKVLAELEFEGNVIDDEAKLFDIFVKPFKASHDVDVNGFLIYDGIKEVCYITDTGYINKRHHELLANKDLYVFESNHDIDMLLNSKYPYYLKHRIISDKGHLSNKDASTYLAKFIGDNTKNIVLAHLSKENNTPELALETLHLKLKETNKDNVNIVVAAQNKRTDYIEV